jgi:hypothetical protein
MENEGFPMIEEVGAPNVMEVPHPEVQTMSPSLWGSSENGPESVVDTLEEGSKVVDPRESYRSYVFAPSTITVGCIKKMASLHYFTKDEAWERREEVIPEPTDDEAMVFEEFFIVRLRMPPQPTLTDILHKF